jgi:DNA-binding beta-propeller fold protein YncE
LLYVTDSGTPGGAHTDSIATLNGTTYAFVHSYPAPGTYNLPYLLALDPASQTLYVALTTGGLPDIAEFSIAAGHFHGSLFPLGSVPGAIYYDPRYKVMNALDPILHELVVINASTGAFLAKIPGFANTTGFRGYEQHDIAGNPATGEVYVGSPGNSTIAYVNGSTHRIDRWLSVMHRPTFLQFDPTTGSLWVGNYDGNVTVYDAATGALLATQNFPHVLTNNPSVVTGFAIDSGKHTVWVAVYAEHPVCNRYTCYYRTGMELVSLNETSYAPIPHGNITFPAATYGWNITGSVVYDPVNQRLYVAENEPSIYTGCNLLVVDAVTHQHLSTVYFPWSFICNLGALLVNPHTGVVYTVSSSDFGRAGLAAVDPHNGSVIGTLYSGAGSGDLQWDGATGQIWIANSVSATISLVQP